MEGLKPAVGGITAGVEAEVGEIAAKAPDVPSVEVKKPRKSLFGGLFSSGRGKMEVGSEWPLEVVFFGFPSLSLQMFWHIKSLAYTLSPADSISACAAPQTVVVGKFGYFAGLLAHVLDDINRYAGAALVLLVASQVPEVDAAVPSAAVDVSLPSVDADVAAPSASVDVPGELPRLLGRTWLRGCCWQSCLSWMCWGG